MRNRPEFLSDLQHLINYHSLEGGSNTPDYILAEYLVKCLELFDTTIQWRAHNKGDSEGFMGQLAVESEVTKEE